jgi:DNA-binding response OmpR family regulator
MNKIKVLLVDDEPVLASIIKESLETREFIVHIALNGIDGWNQFKELKPDICIIDVVLPRKDGFALVSEIRLVDEKVPIMFLTARSETEDVIRGFEIGADDYMKKPFSMEELVLRMKVLIRRGGGGFNTRLDPSEETTIGRFLFNSRRMELSRDREVIQLSQREAELLQLLSDSKNSLLDRKTALIKLWGKDDVYSARSMDVYITRIRKYFRVDSSVEIVNIRGKGYSLIERS